MYVKSKRRHTQLQRRIDKYHLRNEVIAGDGNLRMLLLIGNDGCSGQYTSDVMCGTDAETDFRRHSEYKVLHNLFSLSYFSMASFLRAYHTAYIISNKHAKEKAEHMPCFSANYGTFRLLFICRFAYSMQKYIDFSLFFFFNVGKAAAFAPYRVHLHYRYKCRRIHIDEIFLDDHAFPR